MATVTITPNGAAAQSLPAEIAQVAPALFSVNANGLAAAYAVLVTSEGIQSTEPVYTITNGTAIPAPVSLGSSPDQAYLILYGTAIRGAQGNVSASIHGVNAIVNATIAYAGAQSQFPGLDQVDILIPASLAGSGIVSVILTADGITAITVYVSIQ